MPIHAPQLIETWIVPVMGFTQDWSMPTGFEVLWMKLRSFSSPRTVVVTPRTWDDSWEAIARFISRNSADKPAIYLVGYSWGAGHGCVRLAEEMQKLPIPLNVRAAVFADPVYASKLIGFRWRALLDKVWAPTITVPDNVAAVWWTRQHQDTPCGHDLVRTDGGRRGIRPPVERQLNHDQMDNDPAFHDLVLSVIHDAK